MFAEPVGCLPGPRARRICPSCLSMTKPIRPALTRSPAREPAGSAPINNVISDFRNYFPMNTYLQVTATTPQAFVFSCNGRNIAIRPSFAILSQPGPGYVRRRCVSFRQQQGQSPANRGFGGGDCNSGRRINRPPSGVLPCGTEKCSLHIPSRSQRQGSGAAYGQFRFSCAT